MLMNVQIGLLFFLTRRNLEYIKWYYTHIRLKLSGIPHIGYISPIIINAEVKIQLNLFVNNDVVIAYGFKSSIILT